METLLNLWRKSPVVRIITIGTLVLMLILVIRNPWQEDISFKRGALALFITSIALIVLAIFVIILFLGLFSGFVLPVNHLEEWFQSWYRIILFMFGSHGQALWVKNGKLDSNSRNANTWRNSPKRTKPGVLILDSASGAQLRNSNQFTRTVGPGLTFIPKREYLAGMITLGRQVSFPPVRPLPEEDPFAPQGEKETKEEYQARINRRKGVSGYTRDGVEVIATMLVGFSHAEDLPVHDYDIGPNDDKESKNSFKYNPVAVRRAVKAEAIDSKVQNTLSTERHITWNELPGYFVVNLWREYLRKFNLDELFSNIEDGKDFAGMTGLEVIRERVKARLTQPYDVLLNDEGEIIRQREPSREYYLLRSWGIKVLFSPIRNPQIPPNVEKTQVEKWFSFWEWRAEDERTHIHQKQQYMRRKGRRQALSTYVDNLLQVALPDLPEKRDNDTQMLTVLSSLLEATRRLCISDIELQRVLEDGEEEKEIEKIIHWLNWLRREIV